MRTWARENGHQVADQGMVPNRLRRRTTPPARALPGRPAEPWTPTTP
ncbi:hypothetical protein [Streptomyces microflavus]